MSQITMTKRVQLSAMMFLQYMLFAAWFTQLASYLEKIKVEGTYKALIVSSMAIGSLVSPIICMFADRHFASQKVTDGVEYCLRDPVVRGCPGNHPDGPVRPASAWPCFVTCRPGA